MGADAVPGMAGRRAGSRASGNVWRVWTSHSRHWGRPQTCCPGPCGHEGRGGLSPRTSSPACLSAQLRDQGNAVLSNDKWVKNPGCVHTSSGEPQDAFCPLEQEAGRTAAAPRSRRARGTLTAGCLARALRPSLSRLGASSLAIFPNSHLISWEEDGRAGVIAQPRFQRRDTTGRMAHYSC